MARAHDKYKPDEFAVDTRPLAKRLDEHFLSPLGGKTISVVMLIVLVVFSIFPGSILVVLPVSIILAKRYLYPERQYHNMPYRMPATLNGYDGSKSFPDKKQSFKSIKNRHLYKGKGECLYGYEIDTELQVWAEDNDERTHIAIFGTTGSGKTELIFALLLNQLTRSSGFIVIDAKGDISFYQRTCQLMRRFLREDDLLAINFAAGSKNLLEPQEKKPTNTLNLMLNGSASMLNELLAGLLDGGESGSDSMWVGRAISYISALTKILAFLRDKGEIELSAQTYSSYMELGMVEALLKNEEYINKYGGAYMEVVKPMEDFMRTLPGYVPSKEVQDGSTLEQFGYITMQLTRALGDLSYNYGHIFGAKVGEIDMSDVILNRRCLPCLLPALERSLPNLNMIGRLIVGSVKQILAMSAAGDLEDNIRTGIESRPTSAKESFKLIFDEAGYMIVPGMAIIPAQARSLNISVVFAAQTYTNLFRGSEIEAKEIMSNCTSMFVGKLRDGSEGATFKAATELAGKQIQSVYEGYNVQYSLFKPHKKSLTIRREERSLLDYSSTTAQEQGQFTLISSKKFDTGSKQRPFVVPMMSLYTGGDSNEMTYQYTNDFVPLVASDANPPNIEKTTREITKLINAGILSKTLDNIAARGDEKARDSQPLTDLLVGIDLRIQREIANSQSVYHSVEVAYSELSRYIGNINEKATLGLNLAGTDKRDSFLDNDDNSNSLSLLQMEESIKSVNNSKHLSELDFNNLGDDKILDFSDDYDYEHQSKLAVNKKQALLTTIDKNLIDNNGILGQIIKEQTLNAYSPDKKGAIINKDEIIADLDK